MPIQNQDKLKKVLQWMNEERQQHPELSRNSAIRQAEIKFDLTPKECDFIERNFSKIIAD